MPTLVPKQLGNFAVVWIHRGDQVWVVLLHPSPDLLDNQRLGQLGEAGEDV